MLLNKLNNEKNQSHNFKKGNRQDLIDQTSKEIEILNKYLPEQLSNEELDQIISEVFKEVKPTSIKDFGKLMGKVSPLVKGKTDMGLVNKIIKEKLEKFNHHKMIFFILFGIIS